ncbi:DUF1648 domain-containing protein [Plantibacter sp. YIM 135347]|uniref:DUF1648 domain-containing protein n=1 Tax=Plantibacter sp. YIM 135347 TaxID=3423919 RepID=UPI003D357F6D
MGNITGTGQNPTNPGGDSAATGDGGAGLDPNSASEPAVPRPRRWPFLVGLAIMIATLVIGVLRYPSVPDPMPVHFDAAFQPDRWAPRSFALFLTPAVVGAVVLVVLWIAAAAIPLTARAGARGASTASSTPMTQLSPRPRPTMQALVETIRMMEHLAIATSLLLGISAVATWIDVPAWVSPWLLPVMLVAYLGIIAIDSLRVVRAQRFDTVP